MGKVSLAFPVEKIEGKVSKSDDAYFNNRYGHCYINRIKNPYKGDPTMNQLDIQEKFKSVAAKVKDIIAKQGTDYKAYETAWKANPGKHATLRGYIFSKEFAKA